ncbi:hypothetical protein MTR72_00770 [Bradyrhizobium sp. ISRA442]|uniref:hypothetical protein n=1 Tax=Bradyrhizobium sp. ISRA442 TaxID=2866197 RepID=UPI00311ACF9B
MVDSIRGIGGRFVDIAVKAAAESDYARQGAIPLRALVKKAVYEECSRRWEMEG